MTPNLSSSGFSRREFVSLLAAAGAAAPLAGIANAQEPKSKKKSGAASAPAATAPRSGPPTVIHVFSKPLQWLSYAETAKLIADCGYGGIDYSVRSGGHVVPEKVTEDLPRAVDAARKAGLKVEMITTGINDPREKFTEPVLKTAAKLGIKYYRCGSFSYDEKLGIMGSLQKLKPAIKELADLNQSLGLHGAIQNHSGTRVGGPVWDLYELLKDLDPRWMGVQYDIRHATVEGGQSWPLAFKLLHRWIRCSDIKDFKWMQTPGKATVENVPLGEGIVNFEGYFKLVRELNVSGPMSMHLEYPPFERNPKPLSNEEKLTQFASYMRKDLQALKGWMTKHGIA
jgi:L-ribulose-5-phosphate 3-epimerase